MLKKIISADQRNIKKFKLYPTYTSEADLFYKWDTQIKSVANPDNLKKTVVSGASGTELVRLLHCTNAARIYLVDNFWYWHHRSKVTRNDLLALPHHASFSKRKVKETIGWRSVNYSYKRKFTEGYCFHDIFREKHDFLVSLNQELRQLGVKAKDLEIATDIEAPTFSFLWQYPGDSIKERTVSIIKDNFTDPKNSSSLLKNIMKNKIDIFYISAGDFVYNKISAYIKEIWKSLKPGGFFLYDQSFCIPITTLPYYPKYEDKFASYLPVGRYLGKYFEALSFAGQNDLLKEIIINKFGLRRSLASKGLNREDLFDYINNSVLYGLGVGISQKRKVPLP